MLEKDLKLHLKVKVNSTSNFYGDCMGETFIITGLRQRTTDDKVDIMLEDNSGIQIDGWNASELEKEI